MKKRTRKKIPKIEALKQINMDAAGIDIGSSDIFVCVPEDRDDESVKRFDTFTEDLYFIADWLQHCRIQTIAMESTGIYWIPLYDILEERGFTVYLVNAREVKNLPGRKTDILDCQWIQQLHTYGLLRASFRPSKDIIKLRTLIRHRETLIQNRVTHIQHMQKALHLMNLQLDNVISDITGFTGMRIIRAIVSGQRSPEILSTYRDPHCKNSAAVIAKSLEGNYTPEHIFQLKQALQLYDIFTKLIDETDREIEKVYELFPTKSDPKEKPLKPPKGSHKGPRKNEPAFPLRESLYKMCGVDLTQIDGISSLTAQILVSEIGLDMTKWKTAKHFTSWLGLAPNNDISGGKVLKSKTKRTKNRASIALRVAAQSLYRNQSALGAFYRRMRAKVGAPKAITATAHKLAKIVYLMLQERKEYIDLGAEYYELKHKQRVLKNLNQRANKLGFRLVPVSVT